MGCFLTFTENDMGRIRKSHRARFAALPLPDRPPFARYEDIYTAFKPQRGLYTRGSPTRRSSPSQANSEEAIVASPTKTSKSRPITQTLAPDKPRDQENRDTGTPRDFGTFAHQAYKAAAEDFFDLVYNEEPVLVPKPDGPTVQGFIDTRIGNALIDYKTNNMRNITAVDARRSAHDHGRQMKGYVDSPDTQSRVKRAKGWIIATVPPQSESIRRIYADTLEKYGVGVKFTENENPESVIEAIKSALGNA